VTGQQAEAGLGVPIALALDKLWPKSTESGAIQAERQPFFSGLSSKVIYLPRWRPIVFLIACRSYHRRRWPLFFTDSGQRRRGKTSQNMPWCSHWSLSS